VAEIFAITFPIQAALKRLLDLVIAISLLVFLAPALILVALAIYLESGGPVLFRQTRGGFHGRPFDIFKFRSMRVAENGSDVVQAVRGDARITKVGRFLRATSIDELPQLLNVISGEMSLVGPRSHPRAMDTEYGVLIPTYNLRQKVKPGMTGLAQINGHRGPTPTLDSMRARVELDLAYARKASIGLDLKIILRTPAQVMRGRNAH
jgi:putative colanic acid biosynthesis UDP-glucose lipid carrier transferase